MDSCGNYNDFSRPYVLTFCLSTVFIIYSSIVELKKMIRFVELFENFLAFDFNTSHLERFSRYAALQRICLKLRILFREENVMKRVFYL